MVIIKDLYVLTKNKKPILNSINLKISDNAKIAITGASGSGKSTLINAIMGLNYNDKLNIKGQILLDGIDILKYSPSKRRKLCGNIFGYIPQNPMSAFFSNYTIGEQFIETLMINKTIDKSNAKLRAKNSLHSVNLRDVDRILNSYPAELSGGMIQRVAIAMALALESKYIFADEPTSALDYSNRKSIIDIFNSLSNTTLVIISHNAELLNSMQFETYVFENGEILEKSNFESLIRNPLNDWTKKFAISIKNREKLLWR